MLAHIAIPLVFCFVGLFYSSMCFIKENIVFIAEEYNIMSGLVAKRLKGFFLFFKKQFQVITNLISGSFKNKRLEI